jgi:photosynthetic reaction center H subunit
MPEFKINAVASDNYNGSPIIPLGDPMKDGLGPASYNPGRADRPDMTVHGQPKIVPMRVATNFWLEPRDPNPIGLPVIANDKQVAGTIIDVWVDRSEPQIRYYEVKLAGSEEIRLLPVGYVQWPNLGLWGCDKVLVKSLPASRFRDVPKTKNPDLVTLLEEDMITAFYAGGLLWGKPGRDQPLI